MYYRYLNEELRNSTKFTFKLLGQKMVSQVRSVKHIDRQRDIIMRKNSVRGAIRKSSRRNSALEPAQEGRSSSVPGERHLNDCYSLLS